MAAVTAGPAAPQQVHDPALTVADTQALLAGDFPNMREFQAVVGPAPDGLSYDASHFDAYCGDSMPTAWQSVPMPSQQPGARQPTVTGGPQLQFPCKAEPVSPDAGGGGTGWVPVSDWAAAAPVDGCIVASPSVGCCGGYGDMDAHFGLDTASWNAADEEADFSYADLFPPAGIPNIRTVPVHAKPYPSHQGSSGPQPSSMASDASRLPEFALPWPPCSDGSPLGTPLGSPASGAASGGSDGSAATAAAVSSGTRTRRTLSSSLSGSAASSGLLSAASFSAGDVAGTSRSASQRCAAALMPTIGGPQPLLRRAHRLGTRPSDVELKETIAALQRTTSRVPGSSDEAHTITRAECLERYREKKLRRLDVNTIRYMKRKINADRRPRIKGRFVKAEELDAYRAGLLPGQGGCPP